jgi:hypothetical protein
MSRKHVSTRQADYKRLLQLLSPHRLTTIATPTGQFRQITKFPDVSPAYQSYALKSRHNTTKQRPKIMPVRERNATSVLSGGGDWLRSMKECVYYLVFL